MSEVYVEVIDHGDGGDTCTAIVAHVVHTPSTAVVSHILRNLSHNAVAALLADLAAAEERGHDDVDAVADTWLQMLELSR